MLFKKCPKCGLKKELSEFYNSKYTKDGKRVYCKTCRSKEDKESRKSWSNEKRKQRKQYQRIWDLKHKYNITPEEYEKLYNGMCDICGITSVRLVIDHDHKTGKIRGILCDRCNHMLGHAKDNKFVLYKAIKYLEENK